MPNHRRNWTEAQLIEAVKTSPSYAETLRKLGLVPAGGNHAQIKKYVAELNLDTSHFTGKLWNKGSHYICNRGEPLDEILVENRLVSSGNLRKRLIKEGYLEKKCYKCLNVEWLGEPISLELDHINGIKTDNRLENLTILCPNCHAQTPTYRGRNPQRYNLRGSSPIGEAASLSLASGGESQVRVRISSPAPSNTCFDCKKKISPKATRCKRCTLLLQDSKIDWPTTDDLLDRIKRGSSYLALGRELGVSDNAVRKRILNHPND